MHSFWASAPKLPNVRKVVPRWAQRLVGRGHDSGEFPLLQDTRTPSWEPAPLPDETVVTNALARGCSCHEQIEAVATALVCAGNEDEELTRVICGFSCSGNTQVLMMTAVIMGSAAVTQTLGSLVAGSEALLEDSIAMLIDLGSYVSAMLAENVKTTSVRLAVPGLSLVALGYVAARGLRDSVGYLAHGSGGKDDVDPWIVLLFSAWCLVLDLLSMGAFAYNRFLNGLAGNPINMMAAFAHVAADTVRSVATCVEAVLILSGDAKPASADAWATLSISVAISVGIIYPFFHWCRGLVGILTRP